MKLHGWGRYPTIDAQGHTFEMPHQAAQLLAQPGPWIAYGSGKSYGDSALNSQVFLTRRFNKLRDFDPHTGVVTCESGTTLAELIDVFLPRGWFPKIVPGTKRITVGGAIASDVHGKNHHHAGCFSSSVISLQLMLPDSSIHICSAKKNPELFKATCGGMGLTGLILEVSIQLQSIHSAYMHESVYRCHNLTETLTQFEIHRSAAYSMAWVDCLAKKEKMGRSVLMTGEHARSGRLKPPPVKTAAIPIECPGFLLNKYSVSLFNHLYYHTHPSTQKKRLRSIDSFFFPLDCIANWNRMYGLRGFTQYQFVLPKRSSFEGLQKILAKIEQSGMSPFLAVLKLFGPQNENYFSFPIEGYTLALDFKIEPRLFPLLDELDRIVLNYGGRLYLAKDARMKPETLMQGYPQYDKFKKIRRTYNLRDKLNSLQSLRLGL